MPRSKYLFYHECILCSLPRALVRLCFALSSIFKGFVVIFDCYSLVREVPYLYRHNVVFSFTTSPAKWCFEKWYNTEWTTSLRSGWDDQALSVNQAWATFSVSHLTFVKVLCFSSCFCCHIFSKNKPTPCALQPHCFLFWLNPKER